LGVPDRGEEALDQLVTIELGRLHLNYYKKNREIIVDHKGRNESKRILNVFCMFYMKGFFDF